MFPKYVLLIPGDLIIGFFVVLGICVVSSLVSIRMACVWTPPKRSGLSMAGKGIRIEGLSKRYGEGDTAVLALKEVNMHVEPGEVVGLIGPSGSGKSTLLKCLGAVIDPSAGRMHLGSDLIFDNGWKVLRSARLAPRQDRFAFQAPYLIPFWM